MSDIFVRVLLGFLAGWLIGFLMTRSALKEKCKQINQSVEGTLKVVYDVDDPDHPKMGLEIDSLNYILTHDSILLEIYKTGFPKSKGPVYLESRKDKSA